MRKKTKSTRKPIPKLTQLKLWVKAGGRCEFGSCNKELLKEKLTFTEINLAEIAHIVGVGNDGPRSNDKLPQGDRNKIENLMLLCKEHHHLVDSKQYEAQYPRDLLVKFKQEHEYRIKYLTGILPYKRTTVVRLLGEIGANEVTIPFHHIQYAILPLYPTDEKGIEIDLTHLPSNSKDYWNAGIDIINERIEYLFSPNFFNKNLDHISVFAFAQIPFLIYLGHRMGNKIPMDIYQRHRDTEDWKWKSNGQIAKYKTQVVKRSYDTNKVSLVLSISGKINLNDLPKDVRESHTIYEITLANKKPSPLVLKRKEDLLDFKEQYQKFLREIRTSHKSPKEISLFPAIPVPIAILCGRERLPKVDSDFIIYDYDKIKKGFNKTIVVR